MFLQYCSLLSATLPLKAARCCKQSTQPTLHVVLCVVVSSRLSAYCSTVQSSGSIRVVQESLTAAAKTAGESIKHCRCLVQVYCVPLKVHAKRQWASSWTGKQKNAEHESKTMKWVHFPGILLTMADTPGQIGAHGTSLICHRSLVNLQPWPPFFGLIDVL